MPRAESAIERVLRVRASTALLVFASVCALLLLTNDGPGLCNDTSRLATAQALVEHGTFAIDDTYFSYTCDRIQVGERYYSEKPPLLSVYLAGVFALLKLLTPWTVPGDLNALYFWMTLLSSGLAFGAAVLGVRRAAELLGCREWAAAATALCAGAGTLLLTYSTTISNHSVAGAFIVWIGVLVLERSAREAQVTGGTRESLLAACLASAAVVVDPFAVTLAGPLLLALLYLDRRPLLLLAGGLPLVILHSALIYAIAGQLIVLNLDADLFAYSGSMHSVENLSGIGGMKHDSWSALAVYAFHSLAGYRGLFVYNPPVLLGLAGLVVLLRSRRHRPFALALLVGLLAFLALTIPYTNNYSGETYGIRWHAMISPLFVAAAGACALLSARIQRWWLAGLIALAVPGAVFASIGTLNPWTTAAGDRHSFVEQFSSDPGYIETELDRARSFLKRDQYIEAIRYSEIVLRRDVSQERAWSIGIRAARRSNNEAKLESFRARFAKAELEREVAERIRAMLERRAEPTP